MLTILWIDLFRLYILFSQYRSFDDTQEIWSFVLQTYSCLHVLFLMNKTKDQISWVSSHDLYWENKMYKRKRSIEMHQKGKICTHPRGLSSHIL